MPITVQSTGGSVVETTGTGTVTTNVWGLARIRWYSLTASAGDICTVTDTAGNIIFDSAASGADFSDEIELAKVAPFLGIKVTVLTSGLVFFYLR